MPRSERRRERTRGAHRRDDADDARRRRVVRVALVAVGIGLPTVLGLLAAVTGLSVLTAALVAAVLALAFAACWLGAVGAAHVVARALARR
ncbi:hypothetical protein ACFQMF_08705 [Halorubrum rutilum]|uniref:Uncharacterized protein n=1 Tax=Halorubrum rutilum TaxID=1364933 RepID=A0ABD6AL46_9EURY|nr:hypothetical protein [Halorubrum rutilum]